jgi:two-component system, OmpR family, copper resistance phosphate regulon response regulator CusR
MRILVAEDHPTLAQSIVQGLRDDGYAVDLTLDGNEALHYAMTNTYGCIVLDVMLPGKDGYTILKALRQQGSTVPVLFLTARDAVDDRVRGLDLGADDYVVKPFAWEELLARVRSAVRRQHGKKSATLTVADLEIDTAAKRVSRGGTAIELSAREYSLLEYLAHREGQVVSRADIWEQLYGHDDPTTSNVVDVYIGYLRQKIDRDHEVKLIHTRRGLGYVLTANP